MVTSKQIFDYLPGIWRLSRKTLTSSQWHKSGAECITANGIAAITASDTDPNLLIYCEKVSITNLNGSPTNGMDAKQKYKYRYDAVASTLTKYFYDDRLFYTLNLNQTNSYASGADTTTTIGANGTVITGCGEHLCIEDNYVASYEFRNNDQFTLKYSVNGPKKCYEIVTEYERSDAQQISQLGFRIENGDIL